MPNTCFKDFTGSVINFPDREATSLVKLWILRSLIKLGAHQVFMNRNSIDNEVIAVFLGLEKWLYDSKKFSYKEVKQDLQKQYEVAERKASSIKVPKCLSQNINKLSKLIGLSKTDCCILEFAILLNNEVLLEECTELLGRNISASQLFKVLSALLNLPEKEVRLSLSPKGALQNSGLLSISQNGSDRMQTKLALLSFSFGDNIYSIDSDPMKLLKSALFESSNPQLKPSDFHHIDKELSVLNPFLKNSMLNNRKGVNFFIHGKPGTGKTQLVRVLAKKLGYELFEIANEDDEGEPISGISRIRAYQVAQSILKKRKAIILFDEVEDIFSDGGFLEPSTAQKHKAWMNRMLEENSVPCFWLSNSYQNLDTAFVRRYDMVFELPVPPKKQREKIIRKNCSSFLSNQVINRVSKSENLSPAVVSRAASVVQSIQSDLDEKQTTAAFELLINNTLKTQGHKPIKQNDSNRLPRNYDPRCINADTNIDELADGLKQTKSGRLCIYGPPGTGKTAYGRWLAEQLNMSLLVKRGSDIHSKWVGGTEKNIANAFKKAETDGALLLIDEVEGFLQDRQGAQHSWEISAVNEMLTQMESFSGVFIASTNHLYSLDQASLRRFDLKLKFDYLLPDQSWRLLKSYCEELSLSMPKKETKRALNRLQNITPGDFAAIVRRHKFKPLKTADEMVSVLNDESSLKGGSKPVIGFI